MQRIEDLRDRTMAISNATLGAALITGGARRIGRAIALRLAREGYAVGVHAHGSLAQAQSLCAEIVAQGGRAVAVSADLARLENVERLVPETVAALGPLTLLVNNASAFEADMLGALDGALFDRAFAINLRAPLFLAQSFAAQAPAGASIVNLLDQRVLKPTPLFVSYSLSKTALYGATTSLAQALAPRIRVNAVAPGPVLPSPRQTEADFARQAATLPLGQGVAPEEIAEAVLFLARATSVTGQTIAVDGGQHLAWRTPDADVPE
jgi:NAD(P)-dependent dehydrogenase (short-subunit alcohol dehydrogenase family)